jgi:xanthine dehydrogenase accessory factor
MAIDPVCGMEVDERTSNQKSDLEGNIFYFCCPNCKSRFDKTPSKFMTKN